MSAADKLGGYASGFGDLNAEAIAANVTTDYKLLDKDGAVYGKNDLPVYIAELRNIGDKRVRVSYGSDGFGLVH